jgi:signal transduction histidine kinase
MTALRAIWLGLAVLAAAGGLLLGVPIWLSLAALSCAIVPAAAGFFVTGSAGKRETAELETVLWVAFATLAAASTGGAASPLNILYAVPIALAWTSGEKRLTAEAAAFSLVGYAIATIASMTGAWMGPEHAAALSATYGPSGLLMAGAVAVLGVTSRTDQAIKPVISHGDDPVVALKVKQAETRAKIAEQQLAECRTEVSAANTRLESRTRFFAQTSHELRTPLNAITGFAEMMRNAVFGPLPERYQEYAELIHEGGRDLALVVDDVLDLSRIEAGRFEIEPDLLSLTEHAEAAVHFMADMAARKSIALAMEEGEDVEAFADARAVRQIALNLISNALKFTPEGGHVTVATLEGPGGALLAVSDTGVGMSAEELTRLSRAFEQGVEGRKQKGAGLGLSVVRAFAELHGGRLDIESRQGGGTTIAVFFPQHGQGTARGN